MILHFTSLSILFLLHSGRFFFFSRLSTFGLESFRVRMEPKIEPGFGSTDHRNLEDMSIQDLVSVLRTAFLTQDFDNVEDVLVNRDKRLQTDILRLQEMVDLEKLTRFQAEEDLRNREELCERGKRAQNNYEKLLKEVKKNTILADRETIGELRKKNKELEFEVCELRKLKEKWVDDSNALSELRVTANCSSPTSYINHPSLISMLCERVGVYPKKNEEMVKPLRPITAKRIETCNITVGPHGRKIGYNIQGPTNPWRQVPPSISGWPSPTPGPTNPWGQISPSISGWPNPTPGPTNPWGQIPPSISGCPNPTPGPTNQWGQISPSISGWPNPTPKPTNPQGQILSSNSGWPNPTPGPTNLQGQIPTSNSGWPN
ncbi:hypothetical protein KIW84_020210 [Lathyrus oleraceus]|uniref:Uncharacterized protein n=1 Tax=Pisum sativum TaxID=3888 RepID=A0A9D4YA05_PEA|nr:hypothetical protein KIW84_020210 [Pisum sativum]